MSSFFTDKVCLVTGSTQGLGKELARQLLERGGLVVLNGRKPERERETLAHFAEFAEKVSYAAGDVSEAEHARAIVEHALARFGRLDVLINNAGMSAFGDLEDSTPQVIHEVIASNLIGALHVTHYAIPHIKKTGGNIEFIASLTALHGLGGYSLYSAAKMAFTGAAQALRKELADSRVHVGVLYLGFTQNDEIKRTLSPDGKLEPVPKRDGFKVSTQAESAQLILRQIERKKSFVVHSTLGKVNAFMSRYFPGLLHRILLNAYRKNKKSQAAE
jgi:NAD(P)-dependent dehydrogenase (short-subunit alcohol dehydrogenase family)